VLQAFSDCEVGNPEVLTFIDDRNPSASGATANTGLTHYLVIGFAAKNGRGTGGCSNFDMEGEDKDMRLNPVRYFPITSNFTKYGAPGWLDTWVTAKDSEGKPHKGNLSQKSFKEMCFVLRKYSRRGETIVSFCCGTCTTGVAAAWLGRNSINLDLHLSFMMGHFRFNQLKGSMADLYRAETGSTVRSAALLPLPKDVAETSAGVEESAAEAAVTTAVAVPAPMSGADASAAEWERFFKESVLGGQEDVDDSDVIFKLKKPSSAFRKVQADFHTTYPTAPFDPVSIFRAYVVSLPLTDRKNDYYYQDYVVMQVQVVRVTEAVRRALHLPSLAS
jgi:hypothetical protein